MFPESASGKTLLGVLVVVYGVFALVRHFRHLARTRDEGASLATKSPRLFGMLAGAGLVGVGIWLIVQAQG